MRKPSLFGQAGSEVESYLARENNRNWQELFAEIYRGLRFERNFFAKVIRLTVPATKQIAFPNPLRKPNGDRVEPNHYWIVMDSGNHRQIARGNLWGSERLSFINRHATLSETWDIVILRADAPTELTTGLVETTP